MTAALTRRTAGFGLASFMLGATISRQANAQGSLEGLLARFNRTVGVPAWAAATVRADEVTEAAAVGVLSIDGQGPINLRTDAFHWGSVCKSVTATMIATIVEEGLLNWTTRIAEVLPEVPMLVEYGNATLAQVLNHRANLPTYTRLGPEDARRFAAYSGTPAEQRLAFTRDVLLEDSAAGTGSELAYSNAGPVVAASMAERVTGAAWEDLVRTRVFEPLGMSTAGYGMPASEARPGQTRGHFGPDGEHLTVLGFGPMPGSPVMSPDGDIHSTVADFARYARAHLAGLRGVDDLLPASSIQALHAAPKDGRLLRGGQYAQGWGLREENGQTVHWHNGSAGAFFAQVELYPEDDLGIVVMANAGFAGEHVRDLIADIRRVKTA